MEHVNKLTDLQKYSNLDQHSMLKIITQHTQRYGTVLVSNMYGGLPMMQGEYFEQIVNEYERYDVMVVEYDNISANKSEMVPFRSGSYVYFLFDGETLVYIGQTINLAQRLYQHTSQKKQYDKASFIETHINDRLIVEMVNIRFYKPKYNICVKPDEELFSLILKNLFT